MWVYFLLLMLVGCVGTEEEFKHLYQKNCKEELKSFAPVTCAGKPFLPQLLESKEKLVTLNYDRLSFLMGNYTPEQLKVTSPAGETLWVLALKAGAEKIYMNLVHNPSLVIDRRQTTAAFYRHAPRMFVNYRNYSSLLIDPSMELFLEGNGQNPHSLYPLTSASKDVVLKYLHSEKSLMQIAKLFYETNALRDVDFVRDLEPYLHLSLPFPPQPELTVSLGALVSRKWVFQLKPEFFIENEAFLDPLALAIYEGFDVDAYLPFTRTSNALSVAYGLLDDSQLKKIQHFGFRKINLIKPDPIFREILTTTYSSVKDKLYRGIVFDKRGYKRLRSMVLAIEAGNHNAQLVEYFWKEVKVFIKDHGTYQSFERFIGHELEPIREILTSYGYELNEMVPKYHKHLKKRDLFGEGSL